MKRSVILTVFSLLVLGQLSLAQMPQTISYQGVLRDKATGDIVADDDYDIIFSLYDNVGTAVWSETHSVSTGNPVTVTDGVFSVILGKDTPLSGLSSPPTELGIKVGTDAELSPRVELTSVLYALQAGELNMPATERWYSIPAPEFDNSGSMKNVQPYYVYTNSEGNWYAPVHLPHGATITGFELTITDDDSVDASINLYSVFQSDQSASQIVLLSTLGYTATVTHSDLTLSEAVDNQNYTYTVQVYYTYPKNGWDVRIHNARIRYTINSPLP